MIIMLLLEIVFKSNEFVGFIKSKWDFVKEVYNFKLALCLYSVTFKEVKASNIFHSIHFCRFGLLGKLTVLIFIQIMDSKYEENLKKANVALEKIITIYEDEVKVLKNIIKMQDGYNAKLENYVQKLEDWNSYLEQEKKKSSP